MTTSYEKNGGNDTASCARCHTNGATLLIRSEHLCKECFSRYVNTKVLKRLESNKIRGSFHDSEKKVLIPISFDVSSVSLLLVLDQQLRMRYQHGRHAGYTLHILCVDDSLVQEGLFTYDMFAALQDRFPTYDVSVIRFEDCFSYGIEFDTVVDSSISPEECSAELRVQKASRRLQSPTSRADLIGIVKRRLIGAFAAKEHCDSILYSDSTTRLAERVLAETSKGRGGHLPLLISDGISLDGVPCSYPMRDLLEKEVMMYAKIAEPPIEQLIRPINEKRVHVSSKDLTIDALMGQYFDTVEENYPSIVANVVRTTSKLNATTEANTTTCELCVLPIGDGEHGGEQTTTDSAGDAAHTENKPISRLCSGCIRILQAP